MSDDFAARIVEAAGEAARRAMIVPGCCMEGTGCEMPPCHCSTVAARAALAAAVRECGETPVTIRVIADAWEPGEPFGDWLRALAGIADGQAGNEKA